MRDRRWQEAETPPVVASGTERRSTEQPPSPYAAGAAHYLSAGRRDPVKRLWEEPVNHRVIADAVAGLAVPGSRPLHVVDVGAGAGDGLALLRGGLGLTTQPDRRVRYVGVDPDPTMIATARSLHHGDGDVEFVRGDARDVEGLPLDDVDIVLSAGVPYSHLTHGEFRETVSALLARAARRQRPVALILDVLGRFSIEWVPHWSADRWNYDMSFFHDTDGDATLGSLMSFHTRSSIARAVDDAQRRCAVTLAPVRYWDRSVMVGRHTTTGAFNTEVPNFRSMLNQLHQGDLDLDLDAMLFEAPRADAPDEVLAFFGGLASRWNAVVRRARRREAGRGASPTGRASLAEELRVLEHRTQQGLGAAHSLIALLVVGPSPR